VDHNLGVNSVMLYLFAFLHYFAVMLLNDVDHCTLQCL